MFKKRVTKIINFRKKFKLLDYLIIIFVLFAAIILIKTLTPEEKWVDALIYDDSLSLYPLNSLHVGDIEKDASGKKIAEITSINSYDISKGTLPYRNVYLKTKLLAKVNPRNNELEYKGKVIKVGSQVELKFNYAYIIGLIRELDKTTADIPTEAKILTVKVYDQWPWFADSLKIGEGEVDEKGGKIIELISKEINPAEMTVANANGDTLLRTNPRKVDLTLKIKVITEKFSGDYILKRNTMLSVGSVIAFNVGKSFISDGQIMNIE